MGEEAEDVKPKIDLTINYEGQSQHFRSPPLAWRMEYSREPVNDRFL